MSEKQSPPLASDISDGGAPFRFLASDIGSNGYHMPKNKSENNLTIIQVASFDDDDTKDPPPSPWLGEAAPYRSDRRSHSSPIKYNQRRRYSQGSVLADSLRHHSVLTGDINPTTTATDTLSLASNWSTADTLFNVELLRHSSENIRDLQLASAPSNQSAITMNPTGRRPNKLQTKRHLSRPADDHLIALDDICESPLVKSPNVAGHAQDVPLWFVEPASLDRHMPPAVDKGDAFGPKIVSEILPGTPLEHHHSTDGINALSDQARLSNGSSTTTTTANSKATIPIRSDLTERRKSLDLVNRPPSPAQLMQQINMNLSLNELAVATSLSNSNLRRVAKQQQHNPMGNQELSIIGHSGGHTAGDSSNGYGGGNQIITSNNVHSLSSNHHSHNYDSNNNNSNNHNNNNSNNINSDNANHKSVGNSNHRLNNHTTASTSKEDKDYLDSESLMFRDGRRKIDMVLCYEEESEGVMTEVETQRREHRRCFHDSLVKEGLEIELEDRSKAFDEKTYFLKIHIPWRTETRYAEMMNLRLPVKRFITISVKAWDEESSTNAKPNLIQKWWKKFMGLREFDAALQESEPSFNRATSGGNPEEQFVVKDRATAYTSAQRSALVMQILQRARVDETERVGIRRLLNDGTYLACFPLHEGRYDRAHASGVILDRRILYLEWARPRQFFKKQPLCLIRKYFGDKIALYFCWLGFYTKMLIIPSVVGILCFFYSLATINSEYNTPSREICDLSGMGNTTLCPLCDKACSYQRLHESCLFAKMSYLFDNPSTVFFAIFMSFWATSFLELWKRKQAIITWEWDLHDIDSDEENRPEFDSSAKNFRTNPVTREKEAYTPTSTKAIRYMVTGSAVLFMICVVLAAVLGTIIYRLSLVTIIYSGGGSFLRRHAKIFTTMTAALINLAIIMMLTRIYHRLAIALTNMENPRTHTEYEDSFTFKIFFFEFMNFYSSLIYIAFFKGRFFDYPGDATVRRSDFYRLKGDICDPAGCLSELCIQLAIIMIGKQCWNNFMEYLFPKMYNWWRQRKHKAMTKDESHLHMSWEQDYHLQDPGRLALFDEYLEMILQYGFVTLFVAAFPLAPFFALLNNIAEIRLDAYKMVTQARRPLAERVEGIGAWYGILRIITYAAVVSNAFVIAYTSDFIPRMVYKYVYSPGHNLVGYIDHSLSTFNTSDYKEEWGASASETDPDTCRYRGYRKDSNDPDEPYGLDSVHMHVFCARLAFVVIFEHIVFVITGIMQYIIPEVPNVLKTQMQREQLLAKEAKYQHGLKKSRENDYDELLKALRDQNESTGSRTAISNIRGAGNWLRRMSRYSNEGGGSGGATNSESGPGGGSGPAPDANIEVVSTSRTRKSNDSTVLEIIT